MPLARWSRLAPFALCTGALLVACSDDGGGGGGGGTGNTTQVGTFEGLFDDVATGFNFPLDIGIVPALDPGAGGYSPVGVVPGDIVAANFGTSELLRVDDPSGPVTARVAEPFYDGTASGLSGATGVAMSQGQALWASFEQGGDGNDGAIAILSWIGDELRVLDGADAPGAFARPGGICFGGNDEPLVTRFFYVNMDDGTAWRVDATNPDGSGATFTRVGQGLATGSPGNPGAPGSPVGSNDLPTDGARGCAYHAGSLYVADAQNARVVRFDGADVGTDITGVPLEDAPTDVLSYPTGVSVNAAGNLIVMSYDNAHAFVALLTPTGAFLDNGLYDLNVNSGNHGLQVAGDTIWFTRANNANGALRAITVDQQHPPSTAGSFPIQ